MFSKVTFKMKEWNVRNKRPLNMTNMLSIENMSILMLLVSENFLEESEWFF